MAKFSWEYRLIFIISILIAILLLLNLSKTNNSRISISPSAGEAGGVSVSVAFTGGDQRGWNFNLNFDTHNVNLDTYDYQKGIYLEKDGTLYPSLKIEASGQTHHKKAAAVFEKISPPFSLSIDDLSGISKRVFQITRNL